MSSPNFASILDEAPTEVNRPKPLPVGTYTCVVQGAPVYDKSAKKQTPYVQFTLRPISVGEDVDVEALQEMGGIEGKTFRITFYLTEDSVYRLDEFHQHCGLSLDDKSSRRNRNEDIMNAQVRVYLKHEASPDGSSVYATVAKTLPVD